MAKKKNDSDLETFQPNDNSLEDKNNSLNDEINLINNVNNNYDYTTENINTNKEDSTFHNDIVFNNSKEKKQVPTKIIIIVIAIILVIAIVSIIFFNLSKSKEANKLQNVLGTAANSYYNMNSKKLPAYKGDCTTINLQTLINNNLISNNTLRNKCNKVNTIVKVCQLEDNKYHYTATLFCNNKKLTTKYDDWKETNDYNLINNISDIKFDYSIKTTTLTNNLENIKSETFIEDEIPYEAGTYEILEEKTVYRSRKQSYNWYTIEKQYYPNNVTVESKVNEYYLAAPNTTYNKKGSSATVYKWLIGKNLVYDNGAYVSESVYPYVVKGTEGTPVVWASKTFPASKSYRTIKSGYIYRLRSLESTDTVTKTEYHCKNDTSGNTWVSTNSNCPEETNSKVYEYKCYYKNSVTGKTKTSNWQNNKCENLYHYVNENVNDGYKKNWSTIDCGYSSDAKPYLCDRTSGYIIKDRVWKWYTPSNRTYYSNNNKVSYYKEAPSAQAIKDESTKTTAYTWYKEVNKNLGQATTAPSSDAIRGNAVYSQWSNWSETKPEESSNISIESKKQITLKRIINSEKKWTQISNGYISLDEAISLLKSNGFEVNSLEDIYKDPKIDYDLKIYYRNPK